HLNSHDRRKMQVRRHVISDLRPLWTTAGRIELRVISTSGSAAFRNRTLTPVVLTRSPLRAILVHMHRAVSSQVVPAPQSQKREQRVLVSCLCGEQVAPVLARLGSPWCHECRDDPERRYRIIAESNRPPSPDGELPLAA